jgi:hypothetical protein
VVLHSFLMRINFRQASPNTMNCILPRYALALSRCLLPVISLILLTAQLTYQPICFHSPAAGTATLTPPPHEGTPGLPTAHCHAKVLLSLDKRYDLKPVLSLPAPLFRLTVIPASTVVEADYFSSMPLAGVVRPACLRGPPACRYA